MPEEQFYELLLLREVERVMDTCLSAEEQKVLWEYAERARRKPSKRVVQAIRRIRAELRITD